MPDLLVAPVARPAAERAVRLWHYSKTLPPGRLVIYGVWEDERFIGVVVFGRGTYREPGSPYGLRLVEVAELVRVALTTHVAPVSRIVAAAVRKLRASSPGVRLVLSYADPRHGHHGGIYQAGNWIYLGTAAVQEDWLIHGRYRHNRAIAGAASYARKTGQLHPGESRLDFVRRTIDPGAEPIDSIPKHKYALPLDRAIRRRIAPLAQPYPHAVEAS